MELSDSSVKSGTLGSTGLARLEGIEPGDVTITFPGMDKWYEHNFE